MLRVAQIKSWNCGCTQRECLHIAVQNLEKARWMGSWLLSRAEQDLYFNNADNLARCNQLRRSQDEDRSMDVKVSAAKQIRGSVRTAGDKSVSHRYAMLAGIAEGTSEFENFSSSADCASTLGCMEARGREGAAQRQPRGGGRSWRRIVGSGTGAGLRQQRLDDAHVERRAGGATFYQRDDRRRFAEQASDAPGDRPSAEDGSKDRLARWLRAADDSWREAEGDGVSAAGGQRPGEELRAAGRAVCRRRDHGDRAGAHARSHRAGAQGIRRRGAPRRRSRECPWRPAVAGREGICAGRPVVGHVLFVRGGTVSGIVAGGGFGAAEPDPLRSAGCALRHGRENSTSSRWRSSTAS